MVLAITGKQPQPSKKPNASNNSGRKPAVTSRTLSCGGIGRQVAPLEKPKRQFEIHRADSSSGAQQKSICSPAKSLVKRQQSTPPGSGLPQSLSTLSHQKSLIPQPLPRNAIGYSPRRTSTLTLTLSNSIATVNQAVDSPSIKESTQTNKFVEHINSPKTINNGGCFLGVRDNKVDPCEEDIRDFEACLRSAIHDYWHSSDNAVDELIGGKPQLTSTPLAAKLEKNNVEDDKPEQKLLESSPSLSTNFSLEDVKDKLLFELDVIEKQQQQQSSFEDIIIAPPSPGAFVVIDKQQFNDHKQGNLTEQKGGLTFIQSKEEFTSGKLHKTLSHSNSLIVKEEKLAEEERKYTNNNDLLKVNERTICETKDSHTIFNEKIFADNQSKTRVTEEFDDSGIDDRNNSSNINDSIVLKSAAGETPLTVSRNPSVSKNCGDEGEVRKDFNTIFCFTHDYLRTMYPERKRWITDLFSPDNHLILLFGKQNFFYFCGFGFFLQF